MSGITEQDSRRKGASTHDYMEAWKFCVGTGAGGRGGVSAENQPATERAAHCGIRWTVAVALRSLPMTELSSAVGAAGTGGCAAI
jgi:hypothetical protein